MNSEYQTPPPPPPIKTLILGLTWCYQGLSHGKLWSNYPTAVSPRMFFSEKGRRTDRGAAGDFELCTRGWGVRAVAILPKWCRVLPRRYGSFHGFVCTRWTCFSSSPVSVCQNVRKHTKPFFLFIYHSLKQIPFLLLSNQWLRSIYPPVMYFDAHLYLTAKETHIFNIHFIPETLINIYPKWYEHVWSYSFIRSKPFNSSFHS